MGKKIVKESFGDILNTFVVIFTAFAAQHYVQKAFDSFFHRAKKGFGVSSCVEEVINSLSDNAYFYKLIVKIVQEEGGMKNFLKKVKPSDYDANIFNWSDFDDEGFRKVVKGNASDIVKRILKDRVIQQTIDSSDGCENMDRTKVYKEVGNQIFVWITRPDFDNAIKLALRDTGEKMEDKFNESKKPILLKNLIKGK